MRPPCTVPCGYIDIACRGRNEPRAATTTSIDARGRGLDGQLLGLGASRFPGPHTIAAMRDGARGTRRDYCRRRGSLVSSGLERGSSLKRVAGTPVAAGSSGSPVGAHVVAPFDVGSVRALRDVKVARLGRQWSGCVLTAIGIPDNDKYFRCALNTPAPGWRPQRPSYERLSEFGERSTQSASEAVHSWEIRF